MKALHSMGRSILMIFSMVLTLNCSGSAATDETADPIKFYVGSSDGSLEYSIFLCELNPGNGQFSVIDSFAGAKGPSYLAISPKNKFLYTINGEISDPAQNHMTVSSFAIDPQDLSLKLLNSQSSEGLGPCHIHCSSDGKYIFTANYSSGHSAAFPIAKDGSIKQASSIVIGEGSGPVESRQKGPHAHMVSLDPQGNFLLVPDLGIDKVLVYDFEKESGILTSNPNQPFLHLDPGSGPRHLVFHPNGKFVYVANEINSTVTACSYDGEKGVLTSLHSVSTVSESYTGSKYPAAIRIDLEGKFVYVSTRGERNSITVFKVDEDGRIFRIQVQEVTNWPREFNIDPSGSYLMVAGERSDVIELYQIDRETGKLSKTESKLALPSPACILYID